VAWPNPNPRYLAVKLKGPAESVQVRLYTPAWIRLGAVHSAAMAAGWQRVDLGSALDAAPGGLLYFVVEAKAGSRLSPALRGRLYVLR
jgi:hypothetical protein